MPDAVATYGDPPGADTLGNIARLRGLKLPNLGALNFVLHRALGGGGTISLRTDSQGKTLACALLAMEIELDER